MAEPPKSPKSELKARGLSAKKHFGQNFLTDPRIAGGIAELCTTPAGGTVIEIGAGLGALTRPLLERASHVIAIERDRDLVPVLAEELSREIAEGKLQLLEADAKTVAYRELFHDRPRPRVLGGNLPYQITGPLLELACALAGDVDTVVFLVQLEVAERLRAAPGSESYGALSVFVQAAYDVTRERVVKRGAFHPQPNVDSAVVRLVPKMTPSARETPAFRALVHAAFQQRRKKLKNAWNDVAGLSRERIELAAKAAGIDLDARGETLSAERFGQMAEEIER
jgi:16S rRNA (adenine1518-N6/adenine1519-N6)-dimethyltransferase